MNDLDYATNEKNIHYLPKKQTAMNYIYLHDQHLRKPTDNKWLK